jgi:hypothetical protein
VGERVKSTKRKRKSTKEKGGAGGKNKEEIIVSAHLDCYR